ncbi:MAG: phenylalanine--tRNA ligase subunit beta [Chloroflexi bacterium]|nr:MAG: phenylalanine--tRNA ligase subunit beta [Chloroflexota bacterium]
MKVSLNWLRDYVDLAQPVKELADRLTMSGNEVKGVEIVGQTWDNIVVGQIAAVEPHPNADRLTLVTVDLGMERSTVVCGAPNVRVGDKVPFAKVGAYLIDGHTGERVQLKAAKIRGIVSEGMACSEKELGISDSHEGLMILPAEAPVGVPLADYLGDAVLDMDITPNRPDCLSVIGIAREVAALTRKEARVPAVHYDEEGPPIEQKVSVEIVDADLCRRYCASLIEGVKIGDSPPWIQQRLLACGMRPINNVVDITNYVMLEYGQPLHAFDFGQIGGGKIIVRRASEGERITSLDGVDRTLTSDMLVIADSVIPVAIAGVMGGADSEVIGITRSILLESANFNPASIRRTSMNLKLRSEASLRFERGISPELTLPALRRATQLILELGGGTAARGVIDVYPGRRDPRRIQFPLWQVKRLLGIEMKMDQVSEILGSLGFECRPQGPSEVEVTVPYWRVDVSEAADLVEELARIVGYDYIPTTTMSGPLPGPQFDPQVTVREKLRDFMVGCGFQEVISYSLVSLERLAVAGPVKEALRVANPLSREQEYLRTSLWPSLLAVLGSNQRHEEGGIRLFEIGKAYLRRGDDLPEEREVLGGVVSGPRSGVSWLGPQGWLDFFDIKGVVDALLDRLGIEADFRPVEKETLHPGRAAEVVVGDEVIGLMGEVHPRLVESLDLLPQTVAIFELEIPKLASRAGLGRGYRPLSRFPESDRDIAVVVDTEVPAKKVMDIIKGFPLVTRVTLFDVYTGAQIPPGKKSLAFRVVYQSTTHTLTDEEIQGLERDIVARLSQETGAVLRSR